MDQAVEETDFAPIDFEKWKTCFGAQLQIIRCALPRELARLDGAWGFPSIGWAHESDGSVDALLVWRDGGTADPVWGRVRWQRDGSLELLEFEAADGSPPNPIPHLLTGAGFSTERARQVTWIGPITALAERTSERVASEPGRRESGAPPSAKQLDLGDYLRTAHEELLKGVREGPDGVHLTAPEGPPLVGADAWRKPILRRELSADDELLRRLSTCFNRDVTNLRLTGPHGDQCVNATDLPSHAGCKLIEIVDRRELRERRCHAIYHETGDRLYPLGGHSAPIHRLNEVLRDSNSGEHWRELFADESKAAAYVDLFCRHVYDVDQQLFFDLVLDRERDLRVNPRAQDETLPPLLAALLADDARIGLWRLPLEPDAEVANEEAQPPAAGSSLPRSQGPSVGSEASGEPCYYYSALMLFGRNLYLVALKVFLDNNEVPQILMLHDVPMEGGENLPLRPRTFDPDAHFTLSLRQEGERTSPEPSPAPRAASGRAADPPASKAPTQRLSGEVGGPEFAKSFSDDHWSMPRGESSGEASPTLVVRDAVSLRGRQSLTGSRIVYGARFRGRVDLREIRLRGSLSLEFCVFDEELLLDDAEIEGSLSLAGCAFIGGVRLRGAIVHGTLDMASAYYEGRSDPRFVRAADLSQAVVEGDLDLRGIGQRGASVAPGFRLDGARVGGSLRLGSGSGGHREPMHVPWIDGAGCRVGGSILVRGACAPIAGAGATGLGTRLTFAGAVVGANVECAPHDRLVPHLRLAEDWLDDKGLEPGKSEPRLGSLELRAAHVHGDVNVIGSRMSGRGLDLGGAVVDGSVWVRSRVVQAFNSDRVLHWRTALYQFDARGVRVAGGIVVAGVAVETDLSLVEADVAGMIDVGPAEVWLHQAGHGLPLAALRATVGGDVALSVLRCRSHVRLRGIVARRGVEMMSAHTGSLSIDPALVWRASGASKKEEAEAKNWELIPPQVGGVYVVGCTIEGWLRMRLVQVFGTPMRRGNRGIHIDGTTVHGDLALWQAAYPRDLADTTGLRAVVAAALQRDIVPWHFGAAVHGQVKILGGSEVRGGCFLSLTKVSGAIELLDSRVQGDVMLASLLTHVETSEGDHGLIRALQGAHANRPMGTAQDAAAAARRRWLQRAQCTSLDLSTLACVNDMFVDGLDIVAAGGATPEPRIVARHLRVDGAFVTTSRGVPGDPPAGHTSLTVVGGNVDLSNATINRLAMSSEIVPQGADGGAVRFERAEVRTLELTLVGARREPPVKIDLEGSEVGAWRVRSDDAGGSDGNSADLFDRLLRGEKPVRIATWTAIEAYLRQRGDDDAADELYRRMRQRQHLERAGSTAGVGAVGATVVGVVKVLAIVVAIVLALFLLAQAVLWASSYGPHGPLAIALLLGLLLLLSRSVRDRAQRWFIGYGTRIGPVVASWLALVALSLPVYLDAENFELSNSARAAGKGDGATDRYPLMRQARADWTIGHALGLVLRYHVPIAPMTVLDDWDAKDDRSGGVHEVGFCYDFDTARLPTLACASRFVWRGVSAHAYAGTMQALAWILWPIFLTFMAVKLWRRGKT